ncbi:MAG: hypothetical protein AAGN82_04265, partial [Myxococcota bacterium]
MVEEPERRRFDDDGAGGSFGGFIPSTSTSPTGGGFGGMAVASTTTSVSSSTGGAGPASSSSASTGGGCPDPYPEPNDTQANATELPALPDSCDSSQMVTQGVLSGNDTDWFAYDAKASFCIENTFGSIAGDGQARICAFYECDTGSTTVTCDAGTQPATAPQGQEGCCSSDEVSPSVNCND